FAKHQSPTQSATKPAAGGRMDMAAQSPGRIMEGSNPAFSPFVRAKWTLRYSTYAICDHNHTPTPARHTSMNGQIGRIRSTRTRKGPLTAAGRHRPWTIM